MKRPNLIEIGSPGEIAINAKLIAEIPNNVGNMYKKRLIAYDLKDTPFHSIVFVNVF
jgi:hypothetical protein